jgi:uncharacterized protein (TIGR00255 family)
MALKSMTGFGAGSARAEGVQIAVELSSVNRKQLEVALRLPSQLTAFEPQVQKLVQQSLSRGRVSGSVTLELPAGETAVTVDQNRAEAVIKKLRSSAKKLNLEDDLSASMLLRIPNLLDIQTVEKKSDDLFQTLEKALSVALKKLVTMRAKEGRALSDDLRARLNALEVMLEKIIAFAPAVVSKRRKKCSKGWKSLGSKMYPPMSGCSKRSRCLARRAISLKKSRG